MLITDAPKLDEKRKELADQYDKDCKDTYYPILGLLNGKSFAEAKDALTHCIGLIDEQQNDAKFDISLLRPLGS